MDKNQIQKNVKQGYAKIVKRSNKLKLVPSFLKCCDVNNVIKDISQSIGYSEDDMKHAPEDSNLGIGCGNPIGIASIQKGQTILDLGSGAGFDCFLAARETGESGKVIGIDMTPEMVMQARKNAKKGNYKNVEFIIGEIENLPIENDSIDLIISNCVINLSNQKEQVFREAFRVLKQNGSILFSDIVLQKELPDYVKYTVEGHIACLAGAIRKEDYIFGLEQAGFSGIQIKKLSHFPIELMLNDPIAQKIVSENQLTEIEISEIVNSIASISIYAKKLSQ
ncbi:MAG: arsenite methyltransferase [Saprospiraceae bacterium]